MNIYRAVTIFSKSVMLIVIPIVAIFLSTQTFGNGLVKLYKKNNLKVMYWEAWVDGANVIVHDGIVGEEGNTYEVSANKSQLAENIIEHYKKEALRKGYKPIPLDKHYSVSISYKLDSTWGSTQDLERRYKIQDIVDQALGWSGNGHCDGGNIGMGEMTVTTWVVDPKAAVATIKKTLKESGHSHGHEIYISSPECSTELGKDCVIEKP